MNEIHSIQVDAGHDPAKYFIRKEDGKPTGVLIVPALAAGVESITGRIRSGPDGDLYRFDSSAYRERGDEAVRYVAQVLLQGRANRGRVSEAVGYFENREGVDPLSFDPPRGHVIYTADGILHLSRDWRDPVAEFETYTPDNAWLCAAPWEWDADAPSPERATAFLRDVFVVWDGGEWVPDDEAIRYFLALVGLGLVPRNVLRRAVLLHGKGRNGKSILLHLIQGLYGSENVSAVSLEALGSNRFAAAELRGKLANICGDISSSAGHDSSLFKQSVGGDLVRGERKFGQPFTFESGALPFWSCNVYPRSADSTPAYTGRFSVAHLPRQFEENADKEAELRSIAEDEDEMRGLATA